MNATLCVTIVNWWNVKLVSNRLYVVYSCIEGPPYFTAPLSLLSFRLRLLLRRTLFTVCALCVLKVRRRRATQLRDVGDAPEKRCQEQLWNFLTLKPSIPKERLLRGGSFPQQRCNVAVPLPRKPGSCSHSWKRDPLLQWGPVQAAGVEKLLKGASRVSFSWNIKQHIRGCLIACLTLVVKKLSGTTPRITKFEKGFIYTRGCKREAGLFVAWITLSQFIAQEWILRCTMQSDNNEQRKKSRTVFEVKESQRKELWWWCEGNRV